MKSFQKTNVKFQFSFLCAKRKDFSSNSYFCVSLFFHIICEFLLVWFWLWFFNEWFKCAFLFSLWPMTYHLSVLWLAVSAYSALGGTYLIAFQSHLVQLLILLFSSSFLLFFLFFFSLFFLIKFIIAFCFFTQCH